MARFPLLIALAVTGAMGVPSPARPQDSTVPCQLCTSRDGSERKQEMVPVRLDVEASLDFDRLILAGPGAGSVEMSPDGLKRVTGTIASVGARAMVGRVMIRGEAGRFVRIELPRRIELTGWSGGALVLESIQTDLSADPRLGADGTLSFRFGGILRTTGDVDGEFRGDVPISVDYF